MALATLGAVWVVTSVLALPLALLDRAWMHAVSAPLWALASWWVAVGAYARADRCA